MAFFTCPKCHEPLHRREGGNTLVCPGGHAYDIASEGYVNLLLANQKHSKDPGDSAEMIRARRSFLETDAYRPFSEKLNAIVASFMEKRMSDKGSAGVPAVLLDAGCGEGYYTGRLANALESRQIPVRVYGFDIGKTAVRYASKRYRNVSFAAASAFDIPCSDASVDCLINIFAPIVPAEFMRVIKPGGYMVLAVPGPRHLYGLKELLYEKPYENVCQEIDYSGFQRVGRERVSFFMRLTQQQDIHNLFCMTPYYWKTPLEGHRRLEQMDTLTTEACFDFLTFKRKG